MFGRVDRPFDAERAWDNPTVGLTLDDIHGEVDRLAQLIGPPQDLLPSYGISRDFGYPHIEVNGALMSYVVMERGQDIDRHSSVDLDDILYWVFQSVTFSMAVKWEVAHRVAGQDFRRLMWTKQFELLDVLNPHWTARCRRDLGDRLEDVGL
jgi:hypothetical protein